MGIPYAEFCQDISVPVTITDVMEYPDKYSKSVELFLSQIKPKWKRIDSLSLDYIQREFNNMGIVKNKLEILLDDDDIPDGLLNTLSMELFGDKYNNLVNNNKTIINVTAVYIILLNK